jgi:hypothetical protein
MVSMQQQASAFPLPIQRTIISILPPNEKTSKPGLCLPVKSKDYALEEKGRSDQDPKAPQPNVPVAIDAADGEENLSGSTTRTSSTSTTDRARPDLSLVTTQESMGTSLGQVLTGINVRSRRTNEGRYEKGGKVFVVGYIDEKDPLNPHNWSDLKRMLITFLVAFIGLIVGFASSVDSAAIQQAKIELGVSEVTESLATGIYLIGFGCGYAYQSHTIVEYKILIDFLARSLQLRSQKP